MRGLQIQPSHVIERCTNLTFSHVHVLHTYLQLTKVLTTFGDLRGGAMKVPSTSNQPPPSFPKLIPLPEGPGLRTCASEQPSVTFGRMKTIPFAPEGVGLRVCAPGRPFVTFGLQKAMSFVPKVEVFEFVLLSVHPIPSGMLGFLSLGPANELGSIFRG